MKSFSFDFLSEPTACVCWLLFQSESNTFINSKMVLLNPILQWCVTLCFVEYVTTRASVLKTNKNVTYNRLILLLPTIVSYGSYYMCVSLVPAPIRYGERAKTGWLEIRIMCLHGVTCLSTDCCFSVLSS